MNRLLREASALPQLVKDDEWVGAVVSQQPFVGSRASGTDDKGRLDAEPAAMGDPRTIKETFVPATSVGYRH